MKRELSRKEKDFTNKNIKRGRQEIKDLSEGLKMLKLHKDFRLKKREYEDQIRPFNRKSEDMVTDGKIKEIETDILIKESTIIESLKQIKEGVEEKKPLGV